MSSEEHDIIKMYKLIHGTPSRSCDLEVVMDKFYNTEGVNLVKNGDVCDYISKADLVFDYITKDWGD